MINWILKYGDLVIIALALIYITWAVLNKEKENG